MNYAEERLITALNTALDGEPIHIVKCKGLDSDNTFEIEIRPSNFLEPGSIVNVSDALVEMINGIGTAVYGSAPRYNNTRAIFYWLTNNRY